MIVGEQSTYPRYNNTGVLGPIPGGFQGAVRRSQGLRGFFDMTGQTSAEVSPGLVDPATMTSINAEAVFFTNLYRSWQGLAPLPPQSTAPSVNVGLTPEAKNMLLIGGGILAFVLLRRKRK